MMFLDIAPNLLSSLLTILFPIFASYKALRTSDPAILTPWLMYWVVLSCFSLFEYWTYFIVSWIPFYAYFRLVLFSYLVLPQTQGAKLLYQGYIHPFLAHHEHDIDVFIIEAHEKAKKAGWEYLKMALDWARENVMGQKPKEQPPINQGGTYAQNLLSRFNLPSARQGLAAPAGDFYGMLSAAVGQLGATSGNSREAQLESMSRSGALIPEGMTSNSEKMTFLSTQRERLRMLLTALDKEASDLLNEDINGQDAQRRVSGGKAVETSRDGLTKSRSGTPFERIERDEVEERAAGGGGWSPWTYFNKQPTSPQAKEEVKGSSTGVDIDS